MSAWGQGGFARALLDPAAPVHASITRVQGGTATHRFGIYRNNIHASLTGALRAQFPAVVRLLGDEAFAHFARTYLRQSPPRSPLLTEYGHDFSEFLGQHAVIAPYPFIPDVARIEFAWSAAQQAADQTALAIVALSEIAPERLAEVRLRWHSAAHLIRSRFPAVSICADNRQMVDPPPRDLRMAEDGLIARPSLDVTLRVLPEGGFAFLNALRTGLTLGEAAEAGAAAADTFELAATLSLAFEAGVFAALIQPE